VHDWRPAVRMTPWTDETEGHMIVIEPNGSAQAWPVYDQPDLFLQLGNLLHEPVTAIRHEDPFRVAIACLRRAEVMVAIHSRRA
jgi:hypothetical protein